MRLTLEPHPDTPCAAVREIAVDVAREGRGMSIAFAINGDVDVVLLPPAGPRQRADDLWKHTCFEAFIAPFPLEGGRAGDGGGGRSGERGVEDIGPQAGQGAGPTGHEEAPDRAPGLTTSTPIPDPSPLQGEGSYSEINLSPSNQWAAYRFDGYRTGMAERVGFELLRLDDTRAPDRYVLSAELNLDLPDAPWRLGLSAVIELKDGSKSYWALAHAPGQPDFHHPDAFAAILPPESL